MCIRKFIQQTVFIRNITQIDIFSINLTDTISVCIYNPRIIQQFLRTFRIIGVWIVQFLISIGQVDGSTENPGVYSPPIVLELQIVS